MTNSDCVYPLSPASVHAYAAQIFAPIRRGECVSAIWVPMAGRRLWSKFLIENLCLFEKELPDFSKYLFVYIEPLDLTEESSAGYLRLMGKSLCDSYSQLEKVENCKIFSDEQVSYTVLLENLKICLKKITGKGLHVAFVLGEFDEINKYANSVLYHNLKSLLDKFQPLLSYIFLSVEDLSSTKLTERFGELNAATLENVLYIPLPKEDNIDYLIDRFSSQLMFSFSDEERAIIEQMCGGHPYLLKVATRVVAKENHKKNSLALVELLATYYEIISVARRIFNLRSPEEQHIITAIAEELSVPSSVDLKRLVSLGIVVSNGQCKYNLFCEILKIVSTENHKETKSISTDKQNNCLYLGTSGEIYKEDGVTVDENFTRQEYEVLKLLLSREGKLCTRDQVGEVLWGKESYENYSDWAIDQLMSKVRKKLKNEHIVNTITTVRGRGYKIIA